MIEEILEWIANGKTLREFCRQPGRPVWTVVYKWLSRDESFRERFAQARDVGTDAIAEETLEIIDTFPIDAVSGDGKRLDSAHVAWMRNRVDQRLKLLAKWNPKKYGDKIDLTSKGEKVGLNISIDMGES